MMNTNLDLKDQILLTKLKGKGIAKLNISFSGSGDSGDVDEVGYETNDGINSWQLDLNSRLIESEEENAVKDMIYTWLSNNLRYDWVNNEGQRLKQMVLKNEEDIKMIETQYEKPVEIVMSLDGE